MTDRPVPPALIGRIDTLWRLGAVGALGDAPLLDRFLSDDPIAATAAFETLVNRHGPMVLRLCQHSLGNPHDAEDAAQATFLVLARRARSVRNRDNLGPWLHGVACRIARRARADATRRSRRERPLDADPPAPPPDRDSDWAALHDELDRLPDRHRSPVVLCHLQGLSQGEAATRLGWPLRTLQRRLTEGRARLRDRLTRRGVTVPCAIALLEQSPPVVRPASAWSAATVQAAVGFAKTPTFFATTASILAKGVLNTMFWNEIRRAGVLLAMTGTAALGLARGFSQTNPIEPPPASVPAVAPPVRAFQGEAPDSAKWHVAGVEVLDDETGKPIEGAQARILEFLGLRFYDFKTDPAGKLQFEYPDPDGSGAGLEIRKPGYVPQRSSLGGASKRPADATLTFRLRKGITIGGIIVDEADQPVADATVVLTVSGYHEPRTRPELSDSTEITYQVPLTTGSDGRWTSSEVSPDASVANLQLIHPDYVSGGPTTIGGVDLRAPAFADLMAKTDRQVLKQGVEITGRVTGPDGKSIAGATITDTTAGLSFIEYLRQTTTDADGKFAMHFTEGEQLTLTTVANGFGPHDSAIRVTPGEPPLDITLPPAKLLRVRVVDTAGKPIPGAGGFIPTRSQFAGVFLRRFTDNEGRFRWEDAPDASIPMMFSRKGYIASGTTGPPPLIEVRPTDEEVTVVLKPALTFKIKVRGANANAPVPSYSVEVGTSVAGVDEIKWSPASIRKASMEEIQQTIEVEPANTYRLRIKAPGRQTFVSREIKADEQGVALDVSLEPLAGQGFSGLVQWPDGTPEAGAEVLTGGGGNFNQGKVERAGDWSVIVKTDAEGKFSLPPLENPFPMAVFNARGFARVDRDPEGPIILKPYGRMEGTLKVAGKPAAGQVVSLARLPRFNPNVAVINQIAQTTTDPAGRFSFEMVIPDSHVLISAPIVGDLKTWTEVKPGETRQVILDLEGRPVVGKAVAPDGVSEESWAGSQVSVNLRSDRPRVPPRPENAPADWFETWVNSDEGRAYEKAYANRSLRSIQPDGSFRFDNVGPGEYRLALYVWVGVLPGRGPSSGQPYSVEKSFQIAPLPVGSSAEPIDLGSLKLSPRAADARPVPPPPSPPRVP